MRSSQVILLLCSFLLPSQPTILYTQLTTLENVYALITAWVALNFQLVALKYGFFETVFVSVLQNKKVSAIISKLQYRLKIY